MLRLCADYFLKLTIVLLKYSRSRLPSKNGSGSALCVYYQVSSINKTFLRISQRNIAHRHQKIVDNKKIILVNEQNGWYACTATAGDLI